MQFVNLLLNVMEIRNEEQQDSSIGKGLVTILFCLSLQEADTPTESTVHDGDATMAPTDESTAGKDSSSTSITTKSDTVTMQVHVPRTHYLLGIADLTGELMRMAIHSIGQGDFELPFHHCRFMRVIHDAFVSFGSVDRELSRKVHVLRQSLQKVETACYTLQVRGSEIPKHMLAEALSKSAGDELLSGGNLEF